MSMKEAVEKLREMSNYVFPVYKLEGEEYVRLSHAHYMRDNARQALKELISIKK
jgi:hypothetical protein